MRENKQITCTGELKLSPALTNRESNFLKDFAKTRHFHRSWRVEDDNGKNWVDPNNDFRPTFSDPKYKEIYLRSNINNNKEQKQYELNKWRCIDYHKANPGMPSLYCHWIPLDDNKTLKWDNEDFSKGLDWLKFIIENYINPWRYQLNGELYVTNADSEFPFESGKIIVTDNIITLVSDSEE